MGWFARTAYDRTSLLEQAQRARNRGRNKKAISLLQRVLAADPNDATALRRVAPLLARSKRHSEAWDTYRRIAGQLTRQGFVDQAIGVYREAIASLWRERQLWLALAELEVARKRSVDAVQALLDGARRLRAKRTRPDAVALLVRAREIQPDAFEPSFELANLLLRSGERTQGKRILYDLTRRARGRDLRRLRGRLFRLSPGPGTAWRWLAAAVRG